MRGRKRSQRNRRGVLRTARYASEERLSALNLPNGVSTGFHEMSWDKIIDLSADFRARIDETRPEACRLSKELHFSRMLLLEKMREQSGKSAQIDPKILVDLYKLLAKSERFAQEYSVNLDEYNMFLYLLIQKAKKEKLARHEGNAGRRAPQPGAKGPEFIEEFAHFKAKSDRK
jgi:hypothetical protein